MSAALRARLSRRPVLIVLAVVVAAAAGGFALTGRAADPDLPTAPVARGEFVDWLELRGEITPEKSIVLTSPMQAGDLLIVKLAGNGAAVKAGEVLVEFDGSTLRRTIEEKRSELRQIDAEIEQSKAQARITEEQNATALMKAQYDIERAKLDIGRGDTVSRIENEKAKLALADAEQRLRELQEKIRSDKTSAEADLAGKLRRREQALFDLRRAEDGLSRLQLKAPTDGIVNILPNHRSGSLMGASPEFRQGDRAWPGAAILELPDLSTVHLLARLDETDRSRLEPGQDVIVRIEALPGREFKAKINDISMLARIDFRGSWPPPRQFDLDVILLEVDPQIRPGMIAVARIVTERVPDVLLVPSDAIFQRDGASVVYVLARGAVEERRVEVARRGREQAIIASGVEEGERVATRRPAPEMIRRPL